MEKYRKVKKQRKSKKKWVKVRSFECLVLSVEFWTRPSPLRFAEAGRLHPSTLLRVSIEYTTGTAYLDFVQCFFNNGVGDHDSPERIGVNNVLPDVTWLQAAIRCSALLGILLKCICPDYNRSRDEIMQRPSFLICQHCQNFRHKPH
jgi:hypothetical protein